MKKPILLICIFLFITLLKAQLIEPNNFISPENKLNKEQSEDLVQRLELLRIKNATEDMTKIDKEWIKTNLQPGINRLSEIWDSELVKKAFDSNFEDFKSFENANTDINTETWNNAWKNIFSATPEEINFDSVSLLMKQDIKSFFKVRVELFKKISQYSSFLQTSREIKVLKSYIAVVAESTSVNINDPAGKMKSIFDQIEVISKTICSYEGDLFQDNDKKMKFEIQSYLNYYKTMQEIYSMEQEIYSLNEKIIPQSNNSTIPLLKKIRNWVCFPFIWSCKSLKIVLNDPNKKVRKRIEILKQKVIEKKEDWAENQASSINHISQAITNLESGKGISKGTLREKSVVSMLYNVKEFEGFTKRDIHNVIQKVRKENTSFLDEGSLKINTLSSTASIKLRIAKYNISHFTPLYLILNPDFTVLGASEDSLYNANHLLNPIGGYFNIVAKKYFLPFGSENLSFRFVGSASCSFTNDIMTESKITNDSLSVAEYGNKTTNENVLFSAGLNSEAIVFTEEPCGVLWIEPQIMWTKCVGDKFVKTFGENARSKFWGYDIIAQLLILQRVNIIADWKGCLSKGKSKIPDIDKGMFTISIALNLTM